jgi:hypothetical protein
VWLGDINCAQTEKGGRGPISSSDRFRQAVTQISATQSPSASESDLAFKLIRTRMYSWNKTPGYTAVESDGLASQLSPAEGQGEKLVEMWRHLHPDAIGEYTYYSLVSLASPERVL